MVFGKWGSKDKEQGKGIGTIRDIFDVARDSDIDSKSLDTALRSRYTQGLSSLEIQFQNDTGKTATGGFWNAAVPLDLAQQALDTRNQVVTFDYEIKNNMAVVTKIKPVTL